MLHGVRHVQKKGLGQVDDDQPDGAAAGAHEFGPAGRHEVEGFHRPQDAVRSVGKGRTLA